MDIAAYRDRETGEYPVTLDTIRQRSSMLFGDVPDVNVLADVGVDPVYAAEPPSHDADSHTLREADPLQGAEARWHQTWALVPIVFTATDVDAERDRRIDAGFTFNGTRFQTRPADRENILGAASLAHMAVTLAGKKPQDLRWNGGDADFVWIAADNTLVPMDAPTVIAFGQAAANHKSAHTFAARALKDGGEIPADFRDDRFWPSA